MAIAFIWLARYGWLHGGQVSGTDVLLYFDIGLQGLENTFVLNRYTHIFLLRALTELGTTPMEGMRLFSGFAISVGTLLVYLISRSLSQQSGPINGLIAAGFFLGLPLVLDLLMAPPVDVTVLLIVMTLIAIYIASARNNHSIRSLIILFGAVFLISLKTKEVALASSLFLLGFSITKSDQIDLRKLIGNLKHVAIGLVAGLIIYLIINGVILGDPLFGFRLSDIVEYRTQWSGIIGSTDRVAETFPSLLAASGLIMFTLYVAVGVIEGNQMQKSVTLLWVFPLVLLTVLLLFTTRTDWHIVARGFLVGFAVIAILASQAGRMSSINRSGPARIARTFVIAFGIVLGLIVIGFLTKGQSTFSAYFQAAMAPILFSVILGVMFLFKRRRHQQLLLLLLLIPLSLFPARRNLLDTAAEPMSERPNARFQPILSFREQMANADQFNIYVSEKILPFLLIGNNLDEVSGLMNVVFDLRTGRSNYQIGGQDNKLVEGLLSGALTHSFLVSDDWEWLRTSPQDRPEWRSMYIASSDPTGRYILLTRADQYAEEQ